MLLKELSDKTFWRLTLTLALPIALQNLLSSSLAIIDNVMIGKLGDTAVAAVGEGAQIAFLVNLVIFGACSGGSVFAAQYWGAKKLDGIRHAYGLLLLVTSGVAAFFCLFAFLLPEFAISIFTNEKGVIALGAEYLKIACFSYFGVALSMAISTVLRSVEIVKLQVAAGFSSMICNVALNWILIFGKLGFPEMGVRGAAVATVVSAFVNPLVMVVAAAVKRYIIIAPLREIFGFDRGFVRKFIRIASPVLINESLWALGVCCLNMVFGRTGEANISAVTITKTIENLVFIFYIGICNACSVFVGKFIGAGDTERAKSYGKRYIIIMPIMGVILGTALILSRGLLLGFFDISETAKETASMLLIVYSCIGVIRNIPYIAIVGIFRAGGDTLFGVFCDIGFLWSISVPLTAITALVIKAPFPVVYLVSMAFEDVVKSIICLKRFATGKWIKPVDRPTTIKEIADTESV